MRILKVNDVVKSFYDWGIDDVINARTQLSFRSTENSMTIGDGVTFYNDTELLFRGFISAIDKYENFGLIESSVICKDFSAVADKRIIAESVIALNAGDIVTNFILPILAEEGVIAGDIQQGAYISKANFNYVTCSEALDSLKDLSGFYWNIDRNKQLQFISRETIYSPFTLDDTVMVSNIKVSSNDYQYRNKQYIRGGRGTTSIQTLEKPTPKPDGVSRTFSVRYPLASKPRVFLNSAEVLETDIGVNGLDKNKKFYFTYNSDKITQDSAEVVLPDTTVIEITYTGLYDIIAVSDAPEEISTRGVYESIIEMKNIDTTEQAVESSKAMLEKYGEISDTITFSTEITGLQAGQLLSVNKPSYGLSEKFLIESVSMQSAGDNIYYDVKALDGSALGGWEKFFGDLVKRTGSFVIADNEVLIILNAQQEVESNSGQYIVGEFQPPVISESLIIEFTIGGDLISEVVIVD